MFQIFKLEKDSENNLLYCIFVYTFSINDTLQYNDTCANLQKTESIHVQLCSASSTLETTHKLECFLINDNRRADKTEPCPGWHCRTGLGTKDHYSLVPCLW